MKRYQPTTRNARMFDDADPDDAYTRDIYLVTAYEWDDIHIDVVMAFPGHYLLNWHCATHKGAEHALFNAGDHPELRAYQVEVQVEDLHQRILRDPATAHTMDQAALMHKQKRV